MRRRKPTTWSGIEDDSDLNDRIARGMLVACSGLGYADDKRQAAEEPALLPAWTATFLIDLGARSYGRVSPAP